MTRTDREFHIGISIEFKEDFARLYRMLLRVEYLRNLLPPDDQEAEQIHDDILQLARECIKAYGVRSENDSQTPDGQSNSC